MALLKILRSSQITLPAELRRQFGLAEVDYLEAQATSERSGECWWYAELKRLHGAFLTAINAEETQIEASFCAAVKTAREQKSVSLEKRAEATYAEYRRQKASASGGRGFRLPLW